MVAWYFFWSRDRGYFFIRFKVKSEMFSFLGLRSGWGMVGRGKVVLGFFRFVGFGKGRRGSGEFFFLEVRVVGWVLVISVKNWFLSLALRVYLVGWCVWCLDFVVGIILGYLFMRGFVFFVKFLEFLFG